MTSDAGPKTHGIRSDWRWEELAVKLLSRFSRTAGSERKHAGTVSVPNRWGLGNGEPFDLPARPDMVDVFAQVPPKERYTILHMYLYHPDPHVRLDTLAEAKRIKFPVGSYQPLVDALADAVPAVRQAAAELIWTSDSQVEFTLSCLSDEIHRTGWSLTMTVPQAQAALALLRAAAPAGRARQFEAQVAEIIGRDFAAGVPESEQAETGRSPGLEPRGGREAGALRVLAGHGDPVTGCAFSPDGRQVVSSSWDGTLKVWDTQSGRQLRTMTGHEGWALDCAFSPDGRKIASTGDDDQALKLWDAASGAELRTLTGHTGAVRACAFSPDGTRIASASSDKSVKLWDAESGTELRTLTGHTGAVWACAFSPDGTRIASASDDCTLKIWDLGSGAVVCTLSGHSSTVADCAFSPDGRRVLSTSGDDTLRLWDAVSGAEQAVLTGHTGGVTGCAFSPDGTRIVSASNDRSLKLWDAESGTELRTLTGHTGKVWACAFSPDGDLIVSAGASDCELRIWDATW